MTIRYKCERCGSVLKIKEELAGTDGKCPKCKRKFIVPSAQAADEEGVDHESPSAEDEPAAVSPAKAVSSGQGEEEFDPMAVLGEDNGKRAPVAPAKTPAPATKSKSKPQDQDFDPMAVLMDESGPGAKASAGLTSPPPGPPAAASKPVDRLGRRQIAAPPPSPSQAMSDPSEGAYSSTNASANARDLLTKSMEDSRQKAGVMPEAKRRTLLFDVKNVVYPLVEYLPWVAGGLVAVVGLYWVSNTMFADRLPLPPLGQVTGTVMVDGQPLANVNVVLTPVNLNGESTKGKSIRLRDAMGATDSNGYYRVQYIPGVNGAPIGKVRIWLQPVDVRDYAKIPGKYLQAGADIREVRAAGNEGKFDLDLKLQ